MPETNPITLNTVRIALVCYAIVVAILLAGYRGRRWRNLLRPLWTIGCTANSLRPGNPNPVHFQTH